MDSAPHADPREQRLYPTPEEIDAWATREHRRRTAWLAGPSAEEKQEWARHYRWRAALGLEESRLGPAPEDIEAWAEREHHRRTAWAAGPTEAETQRWTQRQHLAAGSGHAAAPPTPEEVTAWAAREQQRRQEWLAGPGEMERQEWAHQQTHSLFDGLMRLPAILEAEFPESAQRLVQEVELAGKGTLYALSRLPQALWSYFVRAGRALEQHSDHESVPRRRVPY